MKLIQDAGLVLNMRNQLGKYGISPFSVSFSLVVVFSVQSIPPIPHFNPSLLITIPLFAQWKPTDMSVLMWYSVQFSLSLLWSGLLYGPWTHLNPSVTNKHNSQSLDKPYICIWIPPIFSTIHFFAMYSYIRYIPAAANAFSELHGLYVQSVCVAVYTVYKCGCVWSPQHGRHLALKHIKPLSKSN